MMKHMIKAVALLASACLGAASAVAAVTADEAARLKSELTPLGGEKAGNKDGSIPAWDGGYTKAPAGYKKGGPRPDPFAGEKPLLTITAANMDAHADKLDEGQKYLLKKYPDYKINVYPTHRTAAAPQWVYDETFKNATRSKLDGYAVTGAFGGVPFPIVKSGTELMWNHSLRVRPAAYSQYFNSYTVDSGGRPSLASGGVNEITVPYYAKGGTPESIKAGVYYQNLQTTTAPSVRAGELLMYYDQLDNSRPAWQYLVGQRRVRRAPTICCDTPNFVTSGVDFLDQVFVFMGPMDRYEWKLIGKKEMFIPYNNNRLLLADDKEAMKPKFINPDLVRWELHRVWEVEGNLRAGQRDVRPKRKLYFDEDTSIAVIGNTWDAQGTLWHTSFGFPNIQFDVPAVSMEIWTTMDFIKGNYTYTATREKIMDEPWPENYYTPEALSRKGVR